LLTRWGELKSLEKDWPRKKKRKKDKHMNLDVN
jgi:hypothetical protein